MLWLGRPADQVPPPPAGDPRRSPQRAPPPPPRVAPLQLFGQEINPSTFAMARMNAFIHDMEAEIALGDTMRSPRFTTEDGRLRAVRPRHRQSDVEPGLRRPMYENDPYERFEYGIAARLERRLGLGAAHVSLRSSRQAGWRWCWTPGLCAGGSGSRAPTGSGTSASGSWRRTWSRAVILLPENLFYNTSAPGIVMILNRAKRHPGEILLINASKQFEKGRPKNYLTDEDIEMIACRLCGLEGSEMLSAVVTTDEAAATTTTCHPAGMWQSTGQKRCCHWRMRVVLLGRQRRNELWRMMRLPML